MMEACRRCGEAFRPKRLMQVYCSRRCRVADAVARHRSDYKNQPLTTAPEKRLQAPGASVAAPESQPQAFTTNFTEILNGDDYQLEYYEDGYPKLPTCLDRRRNAEPLAEAA